MKNYYVYGMRLRGFAPSCQPSKGFVECMASDDKKELLGDDVDYYHDVLVYNRELTDTELEDYELDYLGKLDICDQDGFKLVKKIILEEAKMDWKEEFKRCTELAIENSKAGLKQEYSYWTGRADGIRWLGEIMDSKVMDAIRAERERK